VQTEECNDSAQGFCVWPAKNDYVSAAVFGLHLKLSLYKAILKKSQ